MTQTRKEILINKYIEFQSQLEKEGINCILFPSIQELDISNLVFMFEFKFSNSTNYKNTVLELMFYYSVKMNNDELDKMYPYIETFINFYFQEFKLMK